MFARETKCIRCGRPYFEGCSDDLSDLCFVCKETDKIIDEKIAEMLESAVLDLKEED